jgi:pimeloyl-ACP methyl ester carboxylesterase
VQTFAAADGTTLAYRRTGTGDPLVVLPGGPMRSAAYLGDLGGLGAQLDLVAHSAGAAIALLYAAHHPDRVGRLALVGPSPRVVDLEVADADRRAVAELRRDESWFPDAFAAFERIWSGELTDANWAAITPSSYGRWDDVARALVAGDATERKRLAAALYYADGAFDAEAVRAALVDLRAPVLLLTGEYDVALPPNCAAEYARLIAHAELVVQPRAGHYPWLDDPVASTSTMAAFLA